ncbi:Glycosyl transferase family 2 [uncultured archaeon]|nr:Glycosyl transferase family 2 [uncultured archaeon]
MSAKPKVSVCITNYNYGSFLKTLVPTLLKQSFEDFELVINDNCSTDGSAGIVGAFKDERVRFAANERNLGMTGNWNAALSRARGELIWQLNADDTIGSDRFIEHMLQAMEAEKADVVCCDTEVHYAATDKRIRRVPLGLGRGRAISGREAFSRVCNRPICMPMIGSYIMKNRGLRLDESIANSDVEFGVRLMLQEGIRYAYCPEEKFVFRIHGTNTGQGFAAYNRPKWVAQIEDIAEKIPERIRHYPGCGEEEARRFKLSHLPYLVYGADKPPRIGAREWGRNMKFLLSRYGVGELAGGVPGFARALAYLVLKPEQKKSE